MKQILLILILTNISFSFAKLDEVYLSSTIIPGRGTGIETYVGIDFSLYENFYTRHIISYSIIENACQMGAVGYHNNLLRIGLGYFILYNGYNNEFKFLPGIDFRIGRKERSNLDIFLATTLPQENHLEKGKIIAPNIKIEFGRPYLKIVFSSNNGTFSDFCHTFEYDYQFPIRGEYFIYAEAFTAGVKTSAIISNTTLGLYYNISSIYSVIPVPFSKRYDSSSSMSSSSTWTSDYSGYNYKIMGPLFELSYKSESFAINSGFTYNLLEGSPFLLTFELKRFFK